MGDLAKFSSYADLIKTAKTHKQKAQAYDALIEAMDDPRLGVSIECYPNWIVRRDGEFAVFNRANKSSKRIEMRTHDLKTALDEVTK